MVRGEDLDGEENDPYDDAVRDIAAACGLSVKDYCDRLHDSPPDLATALETLLLGP